MLIMFPLVNERTEGVRGWGSSDAGFLTRLEFYESRCYTAAAAAARRRVGEKRRSRSRTRVNPDDLLVCVYSSFFFLSASSVQ